MNFSVTLKEVLEKLKTFIIFKDGCPYCYQAADLLRSRGIDFTVLDSAKYEQLNKDITKSTGHKTYPKIYLNKKFIGGCSELYLYFKGEDALKKEL